MNAYETNAAALWLCALRLGDHGIPPFRGASYLPWVHLQMAIWACGGLGTGSRQEPGYDGLAQGAEGGIFLPFVSPTRALQAARHG